jgi:hypothetical protein
VRLPFPDRIPFVAVFSFAFILCGIQLAEGTSGIFSLCCFLFILVAGIAFNLAGGLTRPSGSYVFFFATLTLIVGLCWKAILGEPADSHLEDPMLGISVYLGTMCSICVAVLLSRRIATKRAFLRNMVTESKMQTATVGCIVTGFLLFFISAFFPELGGNGSVLSAIGQVNQFFPLGIVLGTIHTIRRSGGTRSINLPVLLAMVFSCGVGIFGFSKQGIIVPLVCWLLAAASQRYWVSRTQIAVGLFVAFFIFHYLVPYSQYGRNYRQDTLSGNFNVVVTLLSELGNVREQYLQNSNDAEQTLFYGYYQTPQGFFDRLQALSIDSALISNKHQTGFVGIAPIFQAFANFVPHFIWKDKPAINFGNRYAHDIGLLAEEDNTTGISFSPAAEAYALLGWTSVFFVAPIVLTMLFTVFDSLCGNVRDAPWSLIIMVIFAHLAPEGGLEGAIYTMGFITFGIIFSAIVGAYVMPIVGSLFIGPEGIIVRRGKPVQSIPNRLRPASQSLLR